MVILDRFPKKKVCGEYRPKFNIILKPFSLNPQAQNAYITHNIAMKITNLVDII